MKAIPLTNGSFVIVDDQDYDFLKQWNWGILGSRTKSVGRCMTIKNKHINIYMNRVIAERAGLKIDGLEVIYMDHNFLNCCRSNLRVATSAERKTYARLSRNNTTGYRGVYKRKKRKGRNDKDTYMTTIKVDKISMHLGSFNTAEDAALAYNEAARKYYGEFAFQNIIKE